MAASAMPHKANVPLIAASISRAALRQKTGSVSVSIAGQVHLEAAVVRLAHEVACQRRHLAGAGLGERAVQEEVWPADAVEERHARGSGVARMLRLELPSPS